MFMSLLDNPIPPKPAGFTPNGTPFGVEPNLDALVTDSGTPWRHTRPTIRPRMIVVHTNAASVEASSKSQVNWGNRARNNTKPHYAINEPSPWKLVPTDKRSIANSTGSSVESHYGERDASFWTISVETADAGSRAGIGDFLHDHDELVARVIAYESIVWGIPLVVPDRWNGSGVVTHTEPWPYPYFTTARGKTCPGVVKKNRVLRGDILPRAQQIRNGWMRKEVPMFEPYLYEPPRGYDRSVNPVFIVHGTGARPATGRDVETVFASLPSFADEPKNAVRYDLVYKSVVGEEPPR